jgi:glycosyltransferase involved in cell wall biosynthesis
MERFPQKTHGSTERIKICWIGSPSSTEFLLAVERPLQRLARKLDFELIAIGARPFSFDGVRVVRREWSEQSEVADIVSCDIGIMPLTDTPFARGKCAFKLIQYMSCGLPVVASPIGMNRSLVDSRVGALAEADSEWVNALLRMGKDPKMRQEMGQVARDVINQRYSVEAVAPEVERALLQAART